MKPTLEEQYLLTLAELLDDSPLKKNRTGIDTWEQPGVTLKADLSQGFPLLTTKKVIFKHVVSELLWFIRGDTNIAYLHKHGNHIWNEWVDENGDLGPVYGAQWRNFGGTFIGRFVGQDTGAATGIDQLAQAVYKLKNTPDDRRIIVSAWNPLEIELMRLPPCHMMFQLLVSDGKLHTIVIQRSADWFLGVPFNIASYALLTHILAKATGWEPGTLTMTFGSAHLYVNHEAQGREQLTRTPRALPKLVLAEGPDWDGYEPGDVSVVGYDPHAFIKGVVAV